MKVTIALYLVREGHTTVRLPHPTAMALPSSIRIETTEDALRLIRIAIREKQAHRIPMTNDEYATCRTLVHSGAVLVFGVEGSGNDTGADDLEWTAPRTKESFRVGPANFTNHSIISELVAPDLSRNTSAEIVPSFE